MTGKIPTHPTSLTGSAEAANELGNKIWELSQNCWNREPFKRPTTDKIKRFLAELQYPDNRPSIDSDEEIIQVMAEVKKARSEVEIDYNRVYDILLRVSGIAI